jgi:hypothetical protein
MHIRRFIAGSKLRARRGPHNPGFPKCARTGDAHWRALRTGKALAATGVRF